MLDAMLEFGDWTFGPLESEEEWYTRLTESCCLWCERSERAVRSGAVSVLSRLR